MPPAATTTSSFFLVKSVLFRLRTTSLTVSIARPSAYLFVHNCCWYIWFDAIVLGEIPVDGQAHEVLSVLKFSSNGTLPLQPTVESPVAASLSFPCVLKWPA